MLLEIALWLLCPLVALSFVTHLITLRQIRRQDDTMAYLAQWLNEAYPLINFALRKSIYTATKKAGTSAETDPKNTN